MSKFKRISLKEPLPSPKYPRCSCSTRNLVPSKNENGRKRWKCAECGIPYWTVDRPATNQ